MERWWWCLNHSIDVKQPNTAVGAAHCHKQSAHVHRHPRPTHIPGEPPDRHSACVRDIEGDEADAGDGEEEGGRRVGEGEAVEERSGGGGEVCEGSWGRW